MLKYLTSIVSCCRFTVNLKNNLMDLSKVNPILGYEMYSQKDKAVMNARNKRVANELSEQVDTLIKNH